MEQHKEATISLLIQHHQLLMHHTEEILEDPYLRSCKIPLRFKFGVLTPLDLRLGHLLLLWKKRPKVDGVPALILEGEGSGFSKSCLCRFYNMETKTVEERETHINLRTPIFGMRDKFRKQRLSVDLRRIILQLIFPEEYLFSKQLKYGHEQFKKEVLRLGGLSIKQLNGIYLHMTTDGMVRVELRVPNLSRPVSYPGLINHKAVYYKGLTDDLTGSLTAATGFTLMNKTDPERSLFFSKVFDPYAGDSLYRTGVGESILEVFTGYTKGMQEIHETLNVHEPVRLEKDRLII